MADQPTPGSSGSGAFKNVAEGVTFDEVGEESSDAPKPSNDTPESDSTPSQSASEAPEEGQTEAIAEETPAPESEPSTQKTEDAEGAGEAEPVSSVTPAPLFKIKQGDKEIELAANAEVPVVVDGQPQTATLEELRNNYAGKVAWDKKFNDLGKERNAFETDRKAFTQDRTELVNSVNSLHKLAMVDKNPQAAIEALGEMMGAENPRQLYLDMQNQIITQLEEAGLIEGVDREGLTQRLDKEELAGYRQQTTKQKQDAARTQQTQAMKGELDQFLASTAATPEEQAQVMGELRELHKDLMATGQFDKEGLTVKELAEHYKIYRGTKDVREALAGVEGITNQEEAFNDLMKIRQLHPEFKAKDLADIARSVYGRDVAKTLSRKVLKAEPAKAKPRPAPVAAKKEAIGFEDVD